MNGIDLEKLKEFLRLRDEAAELTAQASQKRAAAAELEKELSEQFAASGVQNINCDGSTCYLRIERYANARKEHRQQLVAWARNNGFDDMVVLQASSFKSWCREYIGENGELPEEIAGMVDLHENVKLGVRKS